MKLKKLSDNIYEKGLGGGRFFDFQLNNKIYFLNKISEKFF